MELSVQTYIAFKSQVIEVIDLASLIDRSVFHHPSLSSTTRYYQPVSLSNGNITSEYAMTPHRWVMMNTPLFALLSLLLL